VGVQVIGAVSNVFVLVAYLSVCVSQDVSNDKLWWRRDGGNECLGGGVWQRGSNDKL
jgi:hypothetical protein